MLGFLSIDYSSPLLPEVYLINPRLLGEKCEPIIIRDADKALHFVSPGQLNDNFVKSVGPTLFLRFLDETI